MLTSNWCLYSFSSGKASTTDLVRGNDAKFRTIRFICS